ncbi:MAG TPA: hypothetical protein VKQ30_20195, partial [Ktedonobacterales bacterium]|nr:hypothetical protein [Ktedonobacterales bacterium]
MKRDDFADVLVAHDDPQHTAFERQTEPERQNANEATTTGPLIIDHARARELILEQNQRLLPASEANALADHLLECDRCFRYAQDVAHEERQSGKHNAIR